jgi:hypothetical protein
MAMNKYIPTAPEVVREGLITLGSILVAAFIISRFPTVRAFVAANSVTVKDQNGTVLY